MIRKPKAYNAFGPARREAGRGRHARYYAIHTESSNPVTAKNWDYREEVTGVTFRVVSDDAQGLNYRVPTAEPRTMLGLYPARSSTIELVINGRLLQAHPDLQAIVRVSPLEYNITSARQKRGRVRVRGLPAADRDVILALRRRQHQQRDGTR